MEEKPKSNEEGMRDRMRDIAHERGAKVKPLPVDPPKPAEEK